MDKKELFKEFAKKHPTLIDYVNNHADTTWQSLYEIYDIYGEDESIWNKYINTSSNDILDTLKSIDKSKIKEHINTAQKALTLIEELTSKGNSESVVKDIISPRPLTKFFGD